MKSRKFIPISPEEKKEKIQEISWELYKRWIIKNENDNIFIWHFLDFVGYSFLYNVDIRKEKEIVLEVYDAWVFARESLDDQPNYMVNIIYNLFLKIKRWNQNKKN